jgi:hypothetical protein
MGLKEIYLPILILITLLVFARARLKFGSGFFTIFLCYLGINLTIELCSNVIAYYKGSNLLIYNIAILIEGLAFYYLFIQLNKNKAIQKRIKIIAGLFILFWLADILFIQKPRLLNTYSYLFSCTTLSAISLIAIYLFVFEDTVKNPFHNFFFWASIGILFCYLGNIPYLMFYNILYARAYVVAFSLSIISQIANSILYLMLITGVLCHRPSRQALL